MAEALYKATKLNFQQAGERQLFSGAYYSIVLIPRGSCLFCWDGARHTCGAEDLLLIKPGCAARLEYAGGKYPLEVLWIQYSPALLAQLSSPSTQLGASFNVVPFTCISVRARSEMVMLLKNLAHRMLTLHEQPSAFASDLFEESNLKLFVVLVLRACIQAEFEQRPEARKSFLIDDLFVYIRSHITEEITLEQLEQAFYVSKYHIVREFKRQTGQTVHSYIVKAKLDLCRRYIEEGRPITEVYRLGGFGGYNHFFRAFKKEYGMTPKAYFHGTRIEK